ncbi:unnamed protein product [Timema podura]|uniref:Uncharacterized protein n=1 Tax=Timema podura TaxID=61482 RepID=A0ABN7NT78_TIMPD|nr:unnamed protein product [Timema podura]
MDRGHLELRWDRGHLELRWGEPVKKIKVRKYIEEPEVTDIWNQKTASMQKYHVIKKIRRIFLTDQINDKNDTYSYQGTSGIVQMFVYDSKINIFISSIANLYPEEEGQEHSFRKATSVGTSGSSPNTASTSSKTRLRTSGCLASRKRVNVTAVATDSWPCQGTGQINTETTSSNTRLSTLASATDESSCRAPPRDPWNNATLTSELNTPAHPAMNLYRKIDESDAFVHVTTDVDLEHCPLIYSSKQVFIFFTQGLK